PRRTLLAASAASDVYKSQKLHWSCGYSGVPRMKNLCQLIEQQLRSGVHEEELEPEFLELLDEMDNVAREAKKILG
ncbi:hypothetical protein C9F10_19365, partial [Salmonella enterica subsp. enterica serovar Poona]